MQQHIHYNEDTINYYNWSKFKNLIQLQPSTIRTNQDLENEVKTVEDKIKTSIEQSTHTKQQKSINTLPPIHQKSNQKKEQTQERVQKSTKSELKEGTKLPY